MDPDDWLLTGEEATVGSSNVDRISYDIDKAILYVVFLDGSKYAYYDVDENVARGMRTTMSPGRYVWNVLIADSYDYRRINGPTGRRRKANVIRVLPDRPARRRT